jgi:hypothetical protein
MTRAVLPNEVSVNLPFTPVGVHTQLATGATVQSITVPDGATQWMVQTQTQNIRFTLDGTAATTTKGFLLVASAPPVIVPCYPTQVIKWIEITTTAVLDYQFGM